MLITIIIRNEENWDAKKLSPTAKEVKEATAEQGLQSPMLSPHLTHSVLLLLNGSPVMFFVTKWTFLNKISYLSTALRFIKTKNKPWTQNREFLYTSHSVSITSHINMVYLTHLMNWYWYIMNSILYSNFLSLLFF